MSKHLATAARKISLLRGRNLKWKRGSGWLSASTDREREERRGSRKKENRTQSKFHIQMYSNNKNDNNIIVEMGVKQDHGGSGWSRVMDPDSLTSEAEKPAEQQEERGEREESTKLLGRE